jgi:CDP-paratose 2-epimerase
LREVRGYRHLDLDLRDEDAIEDVLRKYGPDVAVIVHAAAQPSHDWAARAPKIDFGINALATLTLLEGVRTWCPSATFIFMSTNKVYGDQCNRLPMREEETRYWLASDHPFHDTGIDESMSTDQCAHSIFGVSKVAADLMVQEYGRRFGLSTVCFRAGCITGAAHRGASMHGFMAHLCATTRGGRSYSIVGYKGKQVRDILHVSDLVSAFQRFFEAPRSSAVYNIGGGPGSVCSVLEALALCEQILGRRISTSYEPQHRFGDHIWWVTDNRRFQSDYPGWRPTHDIESIAGELLSLPITEA